MMKISVIIPAYNAQAYIREAVESALRQTYGDFEVLVIDDGSTDGTADIVKGFGDRVRYFHQDNRGAAAARNTGIKNARGGYIAFLDADDTWHPDMLKKLSTVLDEQKDAGFVYCDAEFVDQGGKPISSYIRKTKLVEGDILFDLLREHFLMTPAVMLRKECFKETGLFDESLRVGEDYDFFLRLAQNYSAACVKEKLFFRRVYPESLSRQDFVLDYETDLKTLKRFIRNNPELYGQNKEMIDRRVGDYTFDFAYRALENGKNLTACIQLLKMMRYERSARVMKNLAGCLIPLQARRRLKEQLCQK